MHKPDQKPTNSALYWLLCVAFVFAFQSSRAAADEPPTDVSALLYSSTAVELFWTPVSGRQVEVRRNGVVLGVFDWRSLFQSGLVPAETYNYELRSVAPDGARSSPIIISLSTRNFSLPIKRVLPVNKNPVSPPPAQLSPSSGEASPDNPAAAPVPVRVDAPVPASDSTPVQNDKHALQPAAGRCIANSMDALLTCIRQAASYKEISVASDLQCSGAHCCPAGQALLKLHNISDLQILGNGNRLLRTAGHRRCSFLDMENSRNVKISDWHLDDDRRVAGCLVTDRCPSMVHVKRSQNIRFDRTHIKHGKGYAGYIREVDGFEFTNSSMTNAGVLGLYIGHSNSSSSRVRVLDSEFRDNQTNGLALLGVSGNSVSDNLVANNLFIRNHRKGQWPVSAKYGTGLTGGGQFYLAEANNVTIRDNEFLDGFCDNCYTGPHIRSGISGLELGIPNQQSLRSVLIENNFFANHDTFGISHNVNSPVNGNFTVRNNSFANNMIGIQARGAQRSGNDVRDTQHFYSFESQSIGKGFTANLQCSSGGQVARQCSGDARNGRCAIRLHLGEADCDSPSVSLSGPSVKASEGRMVAATGWVSGSIGQWCLVFSNASGNEITRDCQELSASDTSDVQDYTGLPVLQRRAPSGSSSVKLLVSHAEKNRSLLLDDLKLSVR